MLEDSDAASADLLRIAVERSPAGMLVVDVSGVIALLNCEVERLFGYTRQELLGRSIDLLVPDRLRGKHAGLREHYQHEAQHRPMGAGRELYGLHKDGTEVPLEIGLSPVETATGRVVIVSLVDVSARRTLEHQLRQSQKLEALGSLAGGIAHDFNSILLGIMGYTELAKTARCADAAQCADLDQVLRAAERGRQLMQRISSFSRQRAVAYAPVDLERAVSEALQLLRVSLPATIEVHTSFAANTPRVRADETQIPPPGVAAQAGDTGRGGWQTGAFVLATARGVLLRAYLLRFSRSTSSCRTPARASRRAFSSTATTSTVFHWPASAARCRASARACSMASMTVSLDTVWTRGEKKRSPVSREALSFRVVAGARNACFPRPTWEPTVPLEYTLPPLRKHQRSQSISTPTLP
jgi:PAS domain S-box-containing protein